MVNRIIDIVGQFSIFCGISLSGIRFIEIIKLSPVVDILTILMLLIGIIYTILKIFGKLTENKINKIKLREKQEDERCNERQKWETKQ